MKNPCDKLWTPAERRLLDGLNTPAAIQEFLDATQYSVDPIYRSPRQVIRDRQAHCVDGALFAAAALRRLGHRPLIIEMAAVRDDDHLLALFKRDGTWGAVAKSNFSTLRYREPVYRSIRELVMSYFEGYFNVDGEKTMRSYSAPIDLSRFDALAWTVDSGVADVIIARLERARHFPVVSSAQVKHLARVDARSYDAAMLGARQAGLFKP